MIPTLGNGGSDGGSGGGGGGGGIPGGFPPGLPPIPPIPFSLTPGLANNANVVDYTATYCPASSVKMYSSPKMKKFAFTSCLWAFLCRSRTVKRTRVIHRRHVNFFDLTSSDLKSSSSMSQSLIES